MRSGRVGCERCGVKRDYRSLAGLWPGPARMPTTSPAAWQQESRNRSGRLARIAGASDVAADRTQCAAELIPRKLPARQPFPVQARCRSPVVEVSAQRRPETVGLHVGDGHRLIDEKEPITKQACESARAPSIPGQSVLEPMALRR